MAPGCARGRQRAAGRAGNPGERLRYALGQLYRLGRQDHLPVHPDVFDIEDVAARVVGGSGQLQMVTTDAKGKTYHFPARCSSHASASVPMAPGDPGGVGGRPGR